MGRLIIDGNSVFEIDEKCIQKKQFPKKCDIEKYLKNINNKNEQKELKYHQIKKATE